MPGIYEKSNAGAGLRDCLVYFLRLSVSSAPLDMAAQQMIGYGIQHGLGRLRAGGIIKEDEIVL